MENCLPFRTQMEKKFAPHWILVRRTVDAWSPRNAPDLADKQEWCVPRTPRTLQVSGIVVMMAMAFVMDCTHLQQFDDQRKSHGEIDVTLVHFLMKALSDQQYANQQQE